MESTFREHLFPPGHPRFAELDRHDARSYADSMQADPVAGPVIQDWQRSFETTRFQGITSDGTVVPNLFQPDQHELAPTSAATDAAEAFLEKLSPQQRELVKHSIDSKVWRAWMNAEFYVNRFGLRLEELPPEIRESAFELVRASVSPEGYQRIRDVMRTNDFLGRLVGLPKILNEHSYNINIFGVPSRDQPWGWNLYGHHLCLNCTFIGDQQIFTPVFFGAEPNEIDSGPHAGTVVFTEQEQAGLALIRSLPGNLAEQAILYRDKRDPQIPAERLHPGDELHLGGAFQDNRVIPYEGLSISACDRPLQEQVVGLVELFLRYQPEGPREARLADVRRHLDQTWFCWIGGTTDGNPFYYRLQSPVLMIEFDHHAGIFLANSRPERFHVHSLVRTPNGNDYGAALLARAAGKELRLDAPA